MPTIQPGYRLRMGKTVAPFKLIVTVLLTLKTKSETRGRALEEAARGHYELDAVSYPRALIFNFLSFRRHPYLFRSISLVWFTDGDDLLIEQKAGFHRFLIGNAHGEDCQRLRYTLCLIFDLRAPKGDPFGALLWSFDPFPSCLRHLGLAWGNGHEMTLLFFLWILGSLN